jgi:glycosyltransferase involved in cell wall biosynthesis
VEPREGQHYLLEALGRLGTAPRQYEVYFLGRVLDESYYARLAPLLAGSGNAYFLGEVSRAETLEQLNAADVLVCTCEDETGPLVVLEAMGLGKAVISTPVGVIPEIIDSGANGLIVPRADVPGLTAALARLLTDPALAARLGSAAYHTFCQRLTLERYGAEVARSLESLTHAAAADRAGQSAAA